MYDLSDFAEDSPFYDTKNKKVLGKFKDECNGQVATEFVGLRPKMYSLRVVGGKDKKTGKGIDRGFMKTKVTHDDFVRCLFGPDREDKQQMASSSTIRSKKHVLAVYAINKVGLCCYDNKRWLNDDNVSSLCYGHKDIPDLEPEPEPEV